MPSCYTCNRTFRSPRALQDHCEAKEHWNSRARANWCAPCRRLFVNEDALYRHLAESSKHNCCFICARDFPSWQALNQHQRSKIHAVKRTFNCPMCLKSFGLPSSVAQHIESGCHKITRHQVTAAVHSLKVVPTISISRQLQGPTNPTPSIISYSATQLAFNGIAYGCYLCHRTFKKLASLNSHLNSAAHDSNQFKCPKCKGKFTLISALVQHIQSESCGIARFQQVMNEADLLTKKFTKLLLK